MHIQGWFSSNGNFQKGLIHGAIKYTVYTQWGKKMSKQINAGSSTMWRLPNLDVGFNRIYTFIRQRISFIGYIAYGPIGKVARYDIGTEKIN